MNPSSTAPKITLVGVHDKVLDVEGLENLGKIVASEPGGGTPLVSSIRKLVLDIRRDTAKLEAGHIVSVVIATDGMDDDGDAAEVAQALRPLLTVGELVTKLVCVCSSCMGSKRQCLNDAFCVLFQELPCKVSLKLCTDDESIQGFWKAVDSQLDGKNLDVLDDLASEGCEVLNSKQHLSFPFDKFYNSN